MEEQKKNLFSTILSLVVISSIIIGYFTIDFNALYQLFKGEAKFVTQSPECDLHLSSCYVEVQDGTKFELSVEPKTIPLMEPLTFTLKSNKYNLNNLELNIYAVNMFMGEFNLKFKNLGNGNYEAKGTLPTCPIGDMQWNAEIRLEKLKETIGARFQFKTDI